MDTFYALDDDDHPEGGLTMAWMGIDDQMHGNRKFRKLRGDRWSCTGLWVTAGSWCAASLTDGFIPDYVLEDWDPDHGMSKRLVDVGLWLRATHDGEEGYQFHDWEQSNLPAEKIREKRAAHAQRQQDYRDRQKARRSGSTPPDPDGPGDGSRDASRDASRNGHALRDDAPDDVAESFDARDASRATSRGIEWSNEQFDHMNVEGPGLTSECDARDASRDASRDMSRGATPIPSHPIPSLTTRDDAIADAIAPSTAAPSTPRAARPKADPPGFEAFWAACPKKVGKGAARTAYAKALRRDDVTPADLLAAIERMAHFWKITRTEPRFVPHPATWLNQERYADPVPEAPGSALAVGGATDYRGVAPSGRVSTTTQKIADIQALKEHFR